MSVLVVFPNKGHAPSNAAIAAHLREQADWIEQGLQGDIDTVLVILEDAVGGLIMQVAGKPNDNARIAGLLSMVSIKHSLGDFQ